MEFHEIISYMNQFRAALNSFLSQYEPLVLLLIPIFTLFLARFLQSIAGVVSEKGLKYAILEFVMASFK